MKLTFSQSRRRREQKIVAVCEYISMVSVASAFLLAITSIFHNLGVI